jgi:hypothetical protein
MLTAPHSVQEAPMEDPSDLFDVDQDQAFDTLSDARSWMDRNGWIPRHGGGYQVGSRTAIMVPRNASDGDQGVILKYQRL